MREIRQAITLGEFAKFRAEFHKRLQREEE
jgi:hypothetical protein